MALVKWDPFKELVDFRRRMDRLFHEVSGSLLRSEWEEPTLLRDWVPAVDVYEDADKFQIQAELPGMDMKDIEVQVEGNTLTLRGERKLEHEDKRENYHRVERVYGAFQRSFSLPSTVDVDKIEATYDRGVLTITLPKKEETRPKSIQIQVK